MPSPTSSPKPGPQQSNRIDKLDFDANRLKITDSAPHLEETGGPSGRLLRDDGSFFSEVVDGVIERDRRAMRQQITKYVAFTSAILSCLCAGSLTAFSLYGPLFLRHLKYSQYQVNAVSTTAELGMYLPVPLVGWLCDRYNPRPISAFAGICFGLGYALAASVYRAGPIRVTYRSLPEDEGVQIKKEGWPFGVMIFAFVLIGIATASMYLTAVTTCAKNFGKGRHKGITLALPIAAFGLSGMWQSLVGSYCFKDKEADGNVDVFHYFCFLGGLLFVVGLIGSFCLRVVGEEELIEEAVDEMERSGLFNERRSLLHQDEHISTEGTYGTITSRQVQEDSESITSKQSIKIHRSDVLSEKSRLLNAETLLFLSDPTAYLLAAGFFLTSGPGEAYLNNIGTLVHTLYPPLADLPASNSPATHVSVVAVTSTLARLATGVLADLLAPKKPEENDTSYRPQAKSSRRRFTLPRPVVLLMSALLFSIGQLLLATPLVQLHPSILPLNTALVGFGYGAVFSLTPIIISVVWGVENFGTNWGIVAIVPAAGAAIWGIIYSAVYSQGRRNTPDGLSGGGEECYGLQCYQSTFGAMAAATWVAILLWAFAWRGWRKKGILV